MDAYEYEKEQEKQRGDGTNDNMPRGFLANSKRGTGYYFSEIGVDRFLTTNQLSHVIRAHEAAPNGYALHLGGRVITVFSSSNYESGNNDAALALVDQEKIRIMKINTGWKD